MNTNQTDSGSLLEQLSSIPKGKRRGKLRIYLGYAAGVGKTCAMLNDAHEVQKDGIDVVAGYIEPHARPETTALLDGLELLKPLEISHTGVAIKKDTRMWKSFFELELMYILQLMFNILKV